MASEETVRSLVASLGFEVDTSGADKFKKTFKDLTISVRNTSGELSNISFDEFIKNYSKGFEGAANKVSKRVKAAALGIATAASAALYKGFTFFTDKEAAALSLRYRLKMNEDDFTALEKKLDKAREKTGGVVDSLEILNALHVARGASSDISFFVNNLEDLIKSAKVSNITVPQAFSSIASAIKSGDLSSLSELDLFTPEQLDQIRRAGVSLDKASIEERISIIGKEFENSKKRISGFYDEYEKTNKFILEKGGTFLQEGFSTATGVYINQTKTNIEEIKENWNATKKTASSIVSSIGEGVSKTTQLVQKNKDSFLKGVSQTPQAVQKNKDSFLKGVSGFGGAFDNNWSSFLNAFKAQNITNNNNNIEVKINVDAKGMDAQQVGVEVNKQLGRVIRETQESSRSKMPIQSTKQIPK